MSYSGNLPDWHQFNSPQHGRSGTSSVQNVNTSHLFLPSINPSALDTINLATNDRQSKHQRNDVSYGTRNYQASSISGSTCGTNSTSSVHMGPLTNCVGHYGSSPSRNPMMESLSASIDPRIPPVGSLNETELPHRTNQLPFNAPNNHTGAPNIHGGMGSQTSPVGPMSPGRQVPPYGVCKGPCCNPDTNIPFPHWEKYSNYPPNPPYRDSMRSAGYHAENRRYMPDMNLRKDCIENKELVGHGFGVENRRNYSDYKYRKDLPRNYPATSGLLQNYPMQNYNFPSDYQKCPYSVKEYLRRSGPSGGTLMNHQNTGIMKYSSEHQNVNVQQKYNNKQMSYQNGALPTGMSNSTGGNLASPLQNSYFNPQLPRDVSRDFPREYQESNAVGNRLPTSPSAVMHGSYQKYQVYQQKIAMQRFSLENHLRAMSRVPSYQSHPKYQEYLMRYRELVRLQQNVDYQSMLQEAPKIPSPSNASIPPINLQFDQNGVLINSSYNPNHFHGMLNPVNSLGNTENLENTDANRLNINRSLESQNQSLNLTRDHENINHVNDKHQENYLIQKNDGSEFENLIVNVDDIDMSPVTSVSTDVITKARTPTEKPNPKEFANKPDLDVRQFLANWDETEDEEGLATTYAEDIMNNTNTNNNSTNINSNVNNSDINNGDNNTNNNHNNHNKSNNCSNNNKNNNENVNSAVTANTSALTEVNLEKVNQQHVEKPKEVEKNSEQVTIVDESLIVQSNVDSIDIEELKTIEELANSGTIVQCIQTDTDNIPTIHIVDHLPDESELATIQTVYGDVTSLTIEQIAKAPIEIINETSQGQETITLFESDSGVCIKLPECDVESIDAGIEGRVVVEEVVASIIDASVEITESSKTAEQVSERNNESNNESRPKQVAYEKSLIIPQENPAQECSLSIKDHQSTENSNLKKQPSFASEESHNPDDISLPDLPMSECTPVSTTLNTPIHSDSEESSDHITDLSISTNPIEIIPNSPIISFTHSPIKINPYENLENDGINDKRPEDSLNFDIHPNSNSKNKFDNDENNETIVEDFEIARRPNNNNPVTDVESEVQHNNEVPLINSNTIEKENKSDQKDKEFYPSSDPLVGMNQGTNTVFKQNSDNSSGIVDISNDMIPSGDCSGTPVSKILSSDEIDTGKCPSIINTEDFQHSDELDKLCNISLDDACIMPLMTDEGQRNPNLSTSIEDQSFSKVINNILPISDMNVLQSSDEEPLDKDDDDWIEVKSLPESPVNLSSNEMLNRSTNCSVKLLNQSKHSNEYEKLESSQDSMKKKENYTTNLYSPEYSRMEYNSKSDNCLFKINDKKKRDSRKNYVPSIFDISGESQSTDFDKFERKKQEESKQDRYKSLKDSKNDEPRDKSCRNDEDIFNINFKENSKVYDSTKLKPESQGKHSSKKIIDNLQDLQNEKSFESISDALKALENYEMCTVTKSFCRANKDTDVQIQVANINVKEKGDDDANEDVDAIEIKINVSRSERNHGTKQLRDKLTEEVSEVIRKHAFFPLNSELITPRKIFNQRRTSLPDELNTKKPKKLYIENKRRNSGGHHFKTSRRKSTEERVVNDRKNRHFDILSTLSESTVDESIIDKNDLNPTNIHKSSHFYQSDLEVSRNLPTNIFNDYTNTTNIDNIIDYKNKRKRLIRKTSIEEVSKDVNEDEFNFKEDCERIESLEKVENEITFEASNRKKESGRRESVEEKEKQNDTKQKVRNLKSFPLELTEDKNSLQFCGKRKESKRRISIESMEESRRVESKNKKKNYKRRKSTGCTENENTAEFYYEKKEKKSIKRLFVESNEVSGGEFNDINKNLMMRISAENDSDEKLRNNKKNSLKKLFTQSSEDESTLESQSRNKHLSKRLSTEKSKSSNDIINVENFENIMSKSSCDMNLAPSDASLIDNIWNKSNFFVENTSSFDFDNFDLGPNDNSFMNFTSRDEEDGISSRMDEGVRNRRLEDSERYRNPYSNVQPIDLDLSEINLNSTPVYKTQDGKITYSLNPKFTYRKLIQEARRKDHSLLQNSIYSKLLKDYYERKSYRRRLGSLENNEWEDYSPKKIQQPSYHDDDHDDQWEDDDWRKQVDTLESKFKSRWRSKLLEYEELTDNQSVIYSDTSAPPNYSPVESLFQYQHRKYSQMMPFNKKTENYRVDSPVDYFIKRQSDVFSEWDRAINNITSDPLFDHSHGEFDDKVDKSKNIEPRLLNPNDLKSFVNNLEATTEQEEAEMQATEYIPESRSKDKINEEYSDILNIEIQNNDVQLNISEFIDPGLTDEDSKDVSNIAPSMTPSSAKPTANVDVEQDSQAMLTDSGVESSTTYVEGRKSSRKLNKEHKWKKISPELTEEIAHSTQQLNNKEFSELKTGEEVVEKSDLIENNPENCVEIEQTVKETPREEENRNLSELKDEKVVKSSEEKIQPKTVSNIKVNEFLCQSIVRDFHSSVLKGLDLAFPLRQNSKAIPVQINVESVENDFRIHNEMKKVETNTNDKHSMSFLGIKKSTDGPMRRVSSDELEKRKNIRRRNSFLKDISNLTSAETALSTTLNGDTLVLDRNIDVEHNKKLTIVKDKMNDSNEFTEAEGNINNKIEESVIDSQSNYHVFEKPEIPPPRFETFNSITQKSNETESNEVSVESGTPQYIDTLSSTQFGSDCAESKSDETSNVGINFLSTSSQEAIDATDLKQNRVLCAINEETKTNKDTSEITNNQLESENERPKSDDKIFNFSGRISSESEDDSNALDGSPISAIHPENVNNKIETTETDKLLTFSGRIENPKKLFDAQEPLIRIPEEDKEKILSFSGRITSPPKAESKLATVHESKDNKNLTFTGKINKEECGSVCKSSISDKIPKFIIKKTDYSSISSSISQVLPSDVSQKSTETKASSSQKISIHPKIPKMIIRNVKSWPETPTVEENAVELSFPKTHDNDDKVFEVKIKLDDKKQHESRKDSIKKSIGVIECKVPKMKIKLEDHQPKMIFENASMELYSNDSESLKNVPKLKIRKIKRSRSREGKLSIKSSVKKSEGEKSDRPSKNKPAERTKSPETKYTSKDVDQEKQGKIPKLKIKKPDPKVLPYQSDSSRKKRSRTPDNSSKNSKKSSSKHRSGEGGKSKERSPSVDKEGNTNSHQSISEKVPKVIIKRTSSSAEFKCELSKDGGDAIKRDSKWQPEVKLERFKVLDSIAKESGQKKFPQKMLEIISQQTEVIRTSQCSKRSQSTRTSSDPDEKIRNKDDKMFDKRKRRHSDGGRPVYQMKESTLKILDDDSESEDFPRAKKREISKQLDDDSTLNGYSDSKLLEINAKEASVEASSNTKQIKSCLIQIPLEEVATGEFGFPTINSCSNKINEYETESINDSTENEPDTPINTVNIKNSEVDHFEEPESVIKLESSDESQTTIEILPASPGAFRLESEAPTPLEGKRRIANGDLAQLYSEDAIPTQFELELEIVDNSSDSLDVPVPDIIHSINENVCSTNCMEPIAFEEDKSHWTNQNEHFSDHLKKSPMGSNLHQKHESSDQTFSSSDLLVKEVLAAKETLKRCLAKNKIEPSVPTSISSRPKTAAEKKQGAGFNLPTTSTKIDLKDHRNVFQENESTSGGGSSKDSVKSQHEKSDRKHLKSDKSHNSSDKRDKRKSSSSCRRRDKSSLDSSSRNDPSSICHDSIKSLKRLRESSETSEHSSPSSKKIKSSILSSSSSSSLLSTTTTTHTDNLTTKASASSKHESGSKSKHSDHSCPSPSIDNSSKTSNSKKTKVSKAQESNNGSSDSILKPVTLMPILEPENQANFDVNERDTSRSPPVITKQDSQELSSESLKKNDDKTDEKIDQIDKESEAKTFTDIVMQMAYHEKATIKHKRYCPLCERWFPTTERHRRHLDGYQHRHTELTQRRTVHALFMMFTGKPCPRLLPASIVRTDCVPGELTPLQIAVQDVAISLEKATKDQKKAIKKENK